MSKLVSEYQVEAMSPFWATLWIGALIAALLAVPIGKVALRVSGPYYFLITFAFSEVVRLFFNNFFENLFGGP